MPYKKLSLNCKQHSKIRKEYVLIKCFFNSTISFILQDKTYKTHIKPIIQ